MSSNKSFSQRLQEGASQEELKKEYGLNERELIRVMESLKAIHNARHEDELKGGINNGS
jgi:Mor family transcriptional regulator